MRLTKKKMEQENIISDRSIRDKCVGRYEVLEKVKKLLLLPVVLQIKKASDRQIILAGK